MPVKSKFQEEVLVSSGKIHPPAELRIAPTSHWWERYLINEDYELKVRR